MTMTMKEQRFNSRSGAYFRTIANLSLWIVASYLLVTVSAFQSSYIDQQNSLLSKLPSQLRMAESTYNPYHHGDRGSFLAPIFSQEIDFWKTRQRSIFSTNSLALSSSKPFSIFERDDEEEDRHVLLSYLPEGGKRLTPKTKNLLKRVTNEFVYGGTKENESPVTLNDIMSVIEEEYKSYDLPVEINGAIFDVRNSQLESDRLASQIISFAVFNSLPKEITLLLLDDNKLQRCRKSFSEGGWTNVVFPSGVSIRKRRRLTNNSSERYFPIPRSWGSSRTQAAKKADKLARLAAATSAPMQRLLTREEFLESMGQVLGKTKMSPQQILRDALQVFPRRRKQVWKRITQFASVTVDRLENAGSAGIVAYSLLTFAWYTTAILCQWRRLIAIAPVGAPSAFLAASMRHFVRSSFVAYIGAQFTKLPRMSLATALAPVGNWALRSTQKKFFVSEDRAVVILNRSMLVIFVLLSTTLVSADAVITRILRTMFQ